jgi:hypothetical protein
MIDIKLIRENPDLVKENIKKKFQDHKLKMMCSDRLYLSAGKISCFTLRYWFSATNVQWF